MNERQAGYAAGKVAVHLLSDLLKLMDNHDVVKFPVRKRFVLDLNELVFDAVSRATSIGCSVDRPSPLPSPRFSEN
jgi:hypothetical protein